MNIFNIVAFGLSLVQPAGGVLLCNEYGCRSQPYFTPPVIAAHPPVVYMPPNPPVRRQPVYAVRPIPPAYPVYEFPPSRNLVPPPPPPQRRADVPPRPPRVSGDVEEQAEIEGDITAFCDKNPEEAFCGKLGAYLRKHPDRRRK